MAHTFHNDPVQKIKYQTLYKDARESGHMIRGDYFRKDTQKGCLIGLATHGSEHAQFAAESGIPEWLLRLGETCFEGLPEASFMEFPEKLIDAIPVGLESLDLEIIKHKLAVFQIEEICCDTSDPLVNSEINMVLSLHKRFIINDRPKEQDWKSAYLAARSAADSSYSSAAPARSAADSAAYSAYSAAAPARSAAYSAAYSAYSAANSAYSAADSAAYSAYSAADPTVYSAYSTADSAAYSAYSAARSAAYTKMSEEFLRLLRELQPITKESDKIIEREII